MKPPTLCLNMIVKNESKIIERLLKSVLPIIDTYCICDTGSTDNTKELITSFFEKHNIKGKIIEEPFKNFAHNRNFSLHSCVGMSDYVLLLDADMVLDIKNFNKINLHRANHFSILQGSPSFYYYNTRIVKNTGLYKYVGVTHEYIDCPKGTNGAQIAKDELFITDIGDGGAKSDKFERDIRLLTEGLKEEPKNARYHFYLANSYHDSGKYEEAIEIYKKRIDLGGWNQEVWYSYYRIGLCYKKLNQMNNAIQFWLEGYNFYDERIENLYEIINFYRNIGKNKIATIYYDVAIEILNKNVNRDAFLFLHNDVYTWKLYYEYTIMAFYLGKKSINNELMRVFHNCKEENIIRQLMLNMKFYKLILPKNLNIDLTKEYTKQICDNEIKLYSSTPCIMKDNNNYIVNVRLVNFYINKKTGEYKDCEKHVITVNKYVKLDNNFNIMEEKIIESVYDQRRYMGIEDVKIFKEKDKIVFMGTGYHKESKLGVNYGEYDINNELNGVEIKPSFANNACEKNWVFVDYNKQTHIIYGWYPLRICRINPNNNILNLVETKEMPLYFKHMRGSTNGYSYNNEIWFITHLVSYENPRHYYHAFVVFDNELNLLRYSPPFKFEGEPIEYCLGLIVEDDRVIVTYSTWDQTSKLVCYDKKYLDKLVSHKK